MSRPLRLQLSCSCSPLVEWFVPQAGSAQRAADVRFLDAFVLLRGRVVPLDPEDVPERREDAGFGPPAAAPPEALCRTVAIRSSGRSDASALASLIASLA